MIGIVGAGVSGLSLQHTLAAAGEPSITFEATPEPGGVVGSRTVENTTVELGPQRIRLSQPVRQLVTDVGLADDLLEAPDLPLYVYRDGQLCRAPLSPRTAITTDLLTWRSKLRILLEPLTGGVRDGETVAEFLRRSFGEEAATYFFGPLYGGIYASNPADMPMEHSLARALEHAGVSRSVLVRAMRALFSGGDRPPICSFRGGLGRLPKAIFEANSESVRLATSVTSVSTTDDGFLIQTADETVQVEDVVITTPAPVTADLLESVAPSAANRLATLTYNPLAIVHLRSDWHLDGTGFKVPEPAGLSTLGVTATGRLFGREGVYAAFLGGSRDPVLATAPVDHLQDLAEREFEVLTGHEARAIEVTRVDPGMPAYDTSWDALDGLRLPVGIHLCANYVDRAGIAGRIAHAGRLGAELASRGTSTGVRNPVEPSHSR